MKDYLVAPSDRGVVQRVEEAGVGPVEVGRVQGEVRLDRLVQLVRHGRAHAGERAEGSQSRLLAGTHSHARGSHRLSEVRVRSNASNKTTFIIQYSIQ